jgi:hypothetical protein
MLLGRPQKQMAIAGLVWTFAATSGCSQSPCGTAICGVSCCLQATFDDCPAGGEGICDANGDCVRSGPVICRTSARITGSVRSQCEHALTPFRTATLRSISSR